MALQPAGKMVLGGDFGMVGARHPASSAVIGADVPRRRIARFNTDGTPDTTFDTSNGADAWVWAVLPDGNDRLYIGGKFNLVGGIVRHGIARLAELDPTKQIINFPVPDPAVYNAGGAFNWTAGATSSAGIPVAYTSLNTAVCTVDEATGVVTPASPVVTGECTIVANAPAGTQTIDGTPYDVAAAAPVQQTMQIYAAGDQAITFPPQTPSRLLGDGGFPIEHKGLPQRDVQPPGKEGHQRDDQPAFEADGVCRAPGQAAPAHGLARLPALEEGVEHHVPHHRHRRRHHRRHAGTLQAAVGKRG